MRGSVRSGPSTWQLAKRFLAFLVSTGECLSALAASSGIVAFPPEERDCHSPKECGLAFEEFVMNTQIAFGVAMDLVVFNIWHIATPDCVWRQNLQPRPTIP